MNIRYTPALALMAVIAAGSSDVVAAKDHGLATFRDKLSYSIGAQIGGNLKRDKLDLEIETVLRGVKDAFLAKGSVLTTEEMQETLVAFQQRQEKDKAAWRKSEGEKNRRAGKAFLEKNRAATGVITTASGLQYKELKKGKGPRPGLADEVKVHYRGSLIDGTEFDSSYPAGEPAVFGLNGVIPGWVEGLQLMPLGSTYRFFIPPHLAYGDRGAGTTIGPDATLIFDVELLDIRTARN
ncbi:MAG: FKBP-type peptidyl-prolyl cis-trans isomerase [Nitrospinae bacterium]|nr:FKBP-type peptidyl-prolyl cis-trans isomerase [Nitrospinota bacterium]